MSDPWMTPAPDGYDSWTLAANRHLLGYIIRQAQHGVKYCEMGESHPLTQELVAVLVAYKNAWAEDMRECHKPTVAEQRTNWTACMERAEARCREIRASYDLQSTNSLPR